MIKISTPDIDCWYIDTKEGLSSIINSLTCQSHLACDTETYIDLSKTDSSALDPHSSKISLIQINWKENSIPFIIDVIKIGVEDCQELIERVFMNPDIVKVFHNASFDIKQFKSTFNVWIKNVECTMTLLKSLGICNGFKGSQFRGHSLKDMCRDLFGVMLDKTEATSQWGARPLTDTQLSYCSLDVGAFKSDNINCYVLEAYFNLKEALDSINQSVAYTADQHAMYVSAKLEYEGMYVDTDILSLIKEVAEEKTNTYRNSLVKELGFTIYNDVEINDEGEWVSVQVIPDKIKTLLNNNKGLVKYINEFLVKTGAQPLNSLQATEINNYLDALESEVEEEEKLEFDEDFFNAKYDGITLIKNLLSYKKFSKLSSECDKYFNIINPNTKMIHAGFNAIGTSTGRMSSSGNVNLQQVSHVSVSIDVYPQSL